jgi:hypothetical protein
MVSHLASGSPWAIVTNFASRTIQTVDLGTTPPAVYGPFSPADFVLAAGLGGVAIVPGERSALVKNSAGPIYQVDITRPQTPVPLATINTRDIGSDLAVATNGLFAIPTFETLFVVANLTSRTVSGRVLIDPPVLFPNCVAIAPDNSTVVFCDAANRQIAVGRLNSSFTDFETYTTIAGREPFNAVATPDGQTVLVGNSDDTLAVFRIAAPGVLAPGEPPLISGLPGVQASFAVHPNGRLVYVLSMAPSPDRVSILEITGPGAVTVRESGAFVLRSDTDFFTGIERMAITPSGDRLVVGSVFAPELALVDIGTHAVSAVQMNGQIPYGVAVFRGPIGPSEPIPLLSRAALLAFGITLAAVGAILLGARSSFL